VKKLIYISIFRTFSFLFFLTLNFYDLFLIFSTNSSWTRTRHSISTISMCFTWTNVSYSIILHSIHFFTESSRSLLCTVCSNHAIIIIITRVSSFGTVRFDAFVSCSVTSSWFTFIEKIAKRSIRFWILRNTSCLCERYITLPISHSLDSWKGFEQEQVKPFSQLKEPGSQYSPFLEGSTHTLLKCLIFEKTYSVWCEGERFNAQ